MKTYKISAWGHEYEVKLEVSKYVNNGNLAISMIYFDEEMKCWLPYATLTVNLNKLGEGLAYVDTNNCPWAERFIEEHKLGEETGKFGWSGHCIYPMYKFNVEKIKEVA